MNVWRKIGTLFRASAQEPAIRLVDANGIRIFEQELRDAEQGMARAKQELAALMTEKKRLERDNATLQDAIQRRESQALQALDKQEETLATELASLIAEDETLLQRQQQQVARLAAQEATLRRQLRESGRTLRHFYGELRLARANRHAAAVTGALKGHASGLNSQLEDMKQSVARIQGRQAYFTDMDEAMDELEREGSGADLDSRLRAAGIDQGEHGADQVLARLRGSQQSG